MTIDQAYEAIRNNDISSLKTYLVQSRPMSPDVAGILQSFLGYAIERDKYDIVEYLVCEAGVPVHTLNNWYVKWAWYIKKNKKIYDFLMKAQSDSK